MRHANAQWKDPQFSDFDRPLNRRGTSEAEATARRLIELKLLPTAVLTSPARRAQQTADIVVRELGMTGAQRRESPEAPAARRRETGRSLRIEESLYLAPADEILRIICATGPRIPHLMIVGHNPGISEVGNLLAPTLHIGDLTTAAMCSLTFDVRSWADVTAEKLRDAVSEAPPSRLFALWAS
jgi:phosphohistidine phosphatase